jgi:hypothetical protein
VIKLWRSRWSEMSRLTRRGFWLTIVAAAVGLTAAVVHLSSDVVAPWDRVSDTAIFVMFVGMGVQGAGHVRDRRERKRNLDRQ